VLSDGDFTEGVRLEVCPLFAHPLIRDDLPFGWFREKRPSPHVDNHERGETWDDAGLFLAVYFFKSSLRSTISPEHEVGAISSDLDYESDTDDAPVNGLVELVFKSPKSGTLEELLGVVKHYLSDLGIQAKTIFALERWPSREDEENCKGITAVPVGYQDMELPWLSFRDAFCVPAPAYPPYAHQNSQCLPWGLIESLHLQGIQEWLDSCGNKGNVKASWGGQVGISPVHAGSRKRLGFYVETVESWRAWLKLAETPYLVAESSGVLGSLSQS